MTDRPIVYDGALPQTTDVLNAGKFAMWGDAFTALSILGSSPTAPGTLVYGLPCTPTGPASMSVNLGPGCIFQLDASDATAYGDLGVDTTNIYKMGIRSATNTIGPMTAPGTTGFSQNYLVQATMSDVDGGSTVLSYYNASNPTLPYSGPANAGTPNNTIRTCVCTVSIKAGAAATTGTQMTPAPDAGYVGLYVITIANGQASITSGNIALYSAAPFIPVSLPQVPAGVQGGQWTYCVTATADGVTYTGTNAMVAAGAAGFNTPTSLQTGMKVLAKFGTTNVSTTPTFNYMGLGARTIIKRGGAAPSLQDLNGFLELMYDGTNWRSISLLQSDVPPTLSANLVLYVNPSTGSDTLYDGSSATVSGSHGPFATIQHAVNVVATYAPSSFGVTINLSTGTHAGFNTPTWSFPNVAIVGAGIGVGTCLITSAAQNVITVNGPNLFTLDNFSISGSTTGASAITATKMATVNVGFTNSVRFMGITTGAFINCFGGQISVKTCMIDGNANNFFQSTINGNLDISAMVCTINSAVTQSVAFANAAFGSVIGAQSGSSFASFVNPGNVSGPRYLVDLNAVINTGGSGANFFPGTSAGSTASGGQYT